MVGWWFLLVGWDASVVWCDTIIQRKQANTRAFTFVPRQQSLFLELCWKELGEEMVIIAASSMQHTHNQPYALNMFLNGRLISQFPIENQVSIAYAETCELVYLHIMQT